MEARWLLDACLHVSFSHSRYFGYDMKFGIFLEFENYRSAGLSPDWETMGQSRGTWEHKKRDLGFQAWISIDVR